MTSLRHRRSVRRRLSKDKLLLPPSPISPVAAPSEEQEEHEDNKNDVHIFLQNIWAGILPSGTSWVQNHYSPASDSTYSPSVGWGNAAPQPKTGMKPQPSSWRYHRCRTPGSAVSLPSWRPDWLFIGGIPVKPCISPNNAHKIHIGYSSLRPFAGHCRHGHRTKIQISQICGEDLWQRDERF